MRSISGTAWLLFFAFACGSAQNVTTRTVFVGREPLTTGDKGRLLTMLTTQFKSLNDAATLNRGFTLPPVPVVQTSQFDADIDHIYRDVIPGRSLLINDCKGFCDDAFFSFGRIVGQAARSVGMATPALAPKAWYDSVTQVVPGYRDHVRPWNGKPEDQFQLLAVVNRLDFAGPTVSGKWGLAELRFVYGARTTKPKPDPEPFTVIVEFVLPDLPWNEFRAMAGGWHNLRTLQGDPFAVALKALLQQPWSPVADKPSASALVRIRTNSLTGGGSSPWFFAQWALSGGRLTQTALTDEIYRQCTRSDGTNPYTQVGCPQAKPASCAAYRPMYDQFLAKPGLTFAVSESQLLVMNQCYFADDPGMDGPSGICATDRAAGPEGPMGLARKVLSLQQCSNCHGAETNNSRFVHVANRQEEATVADLSLFLTGTNPKPTQAALNEHLQDAVFTARVPVNWPGSTSCPPATITVLRYFNDLARRRLFLAAVLETDASTPPNGDLTQIIKGFGTDMTH